MPSTPAQFFGYGYGPGHHAPMVRMPGCTQMSVQRLEVVRPQGCQQGCGVGCADQSCGYVVNSIAPVAQPCYVESGVMQPVQSYPRSNSQDLFSEPAKPIAPMAPPAEKTQAEAKLKGGSDKVPQTPGD